MGPAGAKRFGLREHVPDGAGELAGDVDPGDLAAALAAEALLVPLVALAARRVPRGMGGGLDERPAQVLGAILGEGPRSSRPPDWRMPPAADALEVIVKLIAATTTRTGLRVRSGLDTNTYPAGVSVSEAAMETLYLRPDAFHGEWNYSLLPRPILPQE